MLAMTDIDSILERIRSGLARHGRKTKISAETGINPATLSQVGDPDWNPSANMMRTLDAALAKLFPADRPGPPHQPD